MNNQDNVTIVNASTLNYVELSNQYNGIISNCKGRDLTTEEETKLLKVIDMYGFLFGVSRVKACEEMRID